MAEEQGQAKPRRQRRKKCARCGKVKAERAFYRSPNTGRIEGYCVECESERRKGTPNNSVAAKRRKLVGEGRMPKITEYQKRLVLKVYRETGNKTAAADAAGIHRNSVPSILEEFKDQLVEKALPPEPKSWEELGPEAIIACEDIAYFSSHYLGIELEGWAIEATPQLMEAYESPEDEFLIVNVAPGVGKTTYFTYVFPIWVAVRERAYGDVARISLGHRAEPKAKWYIKRIRMTLMNNHKLIEDFGRFRSDSRFAAWSETELLIEPLEWAQVVDKEPTFSASSYEGSVLSGRFKLVLWDDLVDGRNSDTAEARGKLADWCDQTAESRIDYGGLFILVGARYGPNDLFWNRMQLAYDDELDADGRPEKDYRRIIYPAHFPDRCTEQHGKDAPAYPDGCLLSPPRAPWKRIRREMMKNEGRFRLVFQQEDGDPVGYLAEKAWFEGGEDARGWVAPGCFDEHRSFGDLPDAAALGGPPLASTITVDPAASNFWAVLHLVRYPNGTTALARGMRRRMKAPDLLYREADGRFTGVLEDWWQLAHSRGYAPRYVVIETRAQQTYLSQYEFVRTWAQQRGVVLVSHDTNRVNKKDPSYGVEMLGPVYREGRLRLPYGGPEERMFADQLAREACAWPEGETDDIVMAHWFGEYHLPKFAAIESSSAEEAGDERPAWARGREPEWAREAMSA